jgi:hypothetical protein
MKKWFAAFRGRPHEKQELPSRKWRWWERLAVSVGGLAVFLFVLGFLTYSWRFPFRDGFVQHEGCSTLYRKYSGGEKLEKPDHPCWRRSVEEHQNYDLLFIEFDDQGWVQNSASLPRPGEDYIDEFFAKLEEIRRRYAEDQRGLSLTVYVHGWHHDADANDSDVRSFRSMLSDLALSDDSQTGARSRTVGIYVGWRGESVNLPYLNMITFWERKNTAERVSLGMIREFFSRLDYFRDRAEQSSDIPLKLLVIGHSFGGLIVYQSLSSEFLRASARYRREDDTGNCSVDAAGARQRSLTQFGDLVLIVNPAFEGTRYEPLKISGQRLKCLQLSQLPLVIIATSTADWATGIAFKWARFIGTIFESAPHAEQEANVNAVGHNPRYTTHLLSLCSEGDSRCAAACKGDAPSLTEEQTDEATQPTPKERELTIAKEQQRAALLEAEEKRAKAKEYFCGGERQRFNLQLTTEDQYKPENNPFWVVQTTGDIMNGHNDIFNPRFEAFTRQMYFRAVRVPRRTSWRDTPCPERCQQQPSL